ncbi:MAG: IS5 family transposase [Candidatus Zophobacter franzmannii]|nr:IS5 family transposase [Candidatus Zophobacter franzmannii]
MIKKKPKEPDFYQPCLSIMLDMNHALCQLSKTIPWVELESEFSELYCRDFGRPANSTRLMVGLHYLKYLNDLSDETVVAQWLENPYWQYFCGEEYFQNTFPIHPTSMTKWRNRLNDNQLDKLLEATIKSGIKTRAITPSDLDHVNVDTTVQEKNITYPTDIRLYYRLMQYLVSLAKRFSIKLKQTYLRIGKKLLRKHSGYVHARQMKRAGKVRKSMKTKLGRLYRDIMRKAPPEFLLSIEFHDLSELVGRAMKQTKTSKNKLYSVHEPNVECICKGKAHKRYEFGCKVGFASTSKKGMILSAVDFHGNPYDGHTLAQTLDMAERVTSFIGSIKRVYADLGYRKHNYTGNAEINIVGRSRKNLTGSQKKWYNRRSAIEPDIGHMKSEHRLDRNYLKGNQGDKLNVILSACGYNLRTVYRHIVSIFLSIIQNYLFSTNSVEHCPS